MPIEEQVAAHYSRSGLSEAILSALVASGKDIDNLVPAELAGADEFHFGWRPATVRFAQMLAFPVGARILDIGAGLGGPARYFAQERRVEVSGIDLTDDYVRVAGDLTRRCGLSDAVSFQSGNALAMPFSDQEFGGAYTVHVAMNISDKQTLFAEARRVLKPGGRFGIYDVMRVSEEQIRYPMPWADTVATSFVERPETYRKWLTAAGFTVEAQEDFSELTKQATRAMTESAAKDGPPPLSLHTLMGPATPERLGNAMQALRRGIFAPVAITARAD